MDPQDLPWLRAATHWFLGGRGRRTAEFPLRGEGGKGRRTSRPHVLRVFRAGASRAEDDHALLPALQRLFQLLRRLVGRESRKDLPLLPGARGGLTPERGVFVW